MNNIIYFYFHFQNNKQTLLWS